jgi:sialic acid synthase SpsE
MAQQMIDRAVQAGVNAVKLQIRDVHDYPPEWGEQIYNGPNSFGSTYLDHRRALELEHDEYLKLAKYARRKGVQIGVSYWSTSIFHRAFGLGPDFLKVPSAMVTNHNILEQCSWAAMRRNMFVIISTGMSTDEEITSAIEDHEWPDGKLAILQCTASYPCANNEVHLRAMETLRDRWGDRYLIGISGHWRGIQIDAAAVALGADVIERHFTLDRTLKGTDHAASLGPGGLDRLVRDVRAVEEALGSPELQLLECEKESKKKLRGEG